MFPDLTRDDVFRIETRRLWLRWPCARDADAIVRLAGTRAVAEMLAHVPYPMPLAEADAFVLRSRAENAAGLGLTLALSRRADPAALIGMIGIQGAPGAAPEIGYWLGEPYWGDGLTAEAVAAMRDAYFAYAGGAALVSSARTINPASRRVLERAGFVQTGTDLGPFPARGGDLPVDRFRLDRARWLGLGAGPAARAA